MSRRFFLAAALAALAARAPGAPGAEHKPGYLVLAPRAAVPVLEPLLELRQERYTVALAACEDLAGPDGRLALGTLKATFRAWHRKAGPLACILLVGDTASGPGQLPAVPTHPLGFDVWFGTLATDEPRAAPASRHRPAIAVGRLPARTRAELEVMVGKTVAYETRRRPGPWQRRIHAVAGTGGYSPAIDRVIDQAGTAILSAVVPQSYRVTMTRGLTSSPYCWPPDRFERRVAELFDGGALFVAYVGHGRAESAMEVTGFMGGTILDGSTLRGLRGPAAGRPIALFVACNMGEFDRPRDCLAEVALKAPGGPVACVASARPSHPYGNAVYGLELTRALLRGQGATLGQRLLQAQRATVAPRRAVDLLRASLDGLSRIEALGGMSRREQEALLARHVYLYSLFGDPALRVAYPRASPRPLHVALDAQGTAWTVRWELPGMDRATAVLSLATPRAALPRDLEPVDPADPAWREAMVRNYRRANRRAVVERRLAVEGGRLEATIPTAVEGRRLSFGTYFVKAFAWDERRAVAAAAAVSWSLSP
ncbi:MAG: C25 family cysteine peptidase [Candidatus Brocadiia bacterium]